VEQVSEAARKSVVVITFAGRDGKRQGLGTGFVVAADGLIATNLHVLGEGRPVSVQLADGRRFDVTSVHASDRGLDLALVRINARDLPALELGDSDRLREGQTVVALGNPLGLTYSVVSGVVSGRRAMQGGSMIQLAIPVEPGNSGGPLLDLDGRVQGIVTLKSAVTANLGFAMPINALKPLLKKPNPIPMTHWVRIGTLDPAEWTVLFDAHWRQRGGKIVAEGAGTGFGGRSLCLWGQPLPALPFEVAVTVKLDDEAGAAGLVFHADGGDRHYGFYPSGGQLRLTRFDGPDVFSWKILSQIASPHYHPGEWNTLKVRLDRGRIVCSVNGQVVVESTDTGLKEGRIGLAKFRDTRAEFKDFRVARAIPSLEPPVELARRVSRSVESLDSQKPLPEELVERLLPDAAGGGEVLRQQARRLEQQAARLRELAAALHQRRIQAQLAHLLQAKEPDIDLLQAVLLIARLDNEDVDVEAYRRQVERMARTVASGLAKGADDAAKLAALRKYLFEEQGFHGSRTDYYNRANSYLDAVLDDREGLPITLSVLYMELARRLGLHVVGVGLPGHFVVRHIPARGEPQLIDVFDGGKPLAAREAQERVEAATGRSLRPGDLEAVSKKEILLRMLHNLLSIAREEGDLPGIRRYLDTMVAIAPDAGPERLLRAAVRSQSGDRQGALEDVDWLLEHRPAGTDLERVLELQRLLSRPER
jgi:regulator of sirC expression with transglutaminase-like and TPR domain